MLVDLFQKHRYRRIRSRVAYTVAAVVLLPYICLCCVTAPEAAAEISARGCCPASQQESKHPAAPSTDGDCCNLETLLESAVSTQYWVDAPNPVRPGTPAADRPVPESVRRSAIAVTTGFADTGPPRFLRNASFLL